MKNFFWIVLMAVTLISCSKDPVSVNVASFNLRLNTERDSLNAWPYRAEYVRSLIRFHEFEVFGVQEALPEQMEFLSGMPEYTAIGSGRDGDGKGEHSAVLFRNDRFELLDSGDFWFSETPDVPSKGWDAKCCNRICSWAKLKDRKSGKEMVFYCAHFDHQGDIARIKSAEMMVEKINKIDKNTPVVFVGDLNSVPSSAAYQVLSGNIRDAALVSETDPYGPEGTFNNFDWNTIPSDRIDYIFVNGPVAVKKYGVLTDSKGKRYPSDHFPIMAQIQFN